MIEKIHVQRIKNGNTFHEEADLIWEEPLQIIIEGNPYAITMRLPGDEIPLAAGFCLTDGIVENINDLSGVNFCKESKNKIFVSIAEERHPHIQQHLARKSFMSQSSCGLCGKELLQEICTTFSPIKKYTSISIQKIFSYTQILKEQQKLFVKTGAVHASAIFDEQENCIAFAEDVGRHNALDKAIGKAFLHETLKNAKVAICSSRASFEIVQKVARAKIPILAVVSAPTQLAVALANSAGVCLIGFVRQPNATIYTFPEKVLQ